MTRRKTRLEIHDLTGGLNTELNPLDEQPNFSYDEINMEIRADKSRVKRYGMDQEEGAIWFDSGIKLRAGSPLAYHVFLWENVGGNAGLKFRVVQIGNSVFIYNDIDPSTILHRLEYPPSTYSTPYSLTSVDGILVIANGTNTIDTVEYSDGVFRVSGRNLLIRDMFGTSVRTSFQAGIDDLRTGHNIEIRPPQLMHSPFSLVQHVYNLRNQTFAIPHLIEGGSVVEDPIQAFMDASSNTNNLLPSNSDNQNMFLYQDTSLNSDRTALRYWPNDAFRDSLGTTPAPMGYFIIDALNRGASRHEEIVKLYDRHPELDYKPLGSLDPGFYALDRTPGGAKEVCEYAGRIWYAGFSGEVEGGDPQSPRLSSYVLFSRLVRDVSDISKCYQDADPTNREDSDIVDTDGGFIRIDGAYDIQRMINVGDSLFIFARNGVWRVSGVDQGIFTATSYGVSKVSLKGTTNGSSVIEVEGSILYWAEDGIFAITASSIEGVSVTDLTKDTINQFYNKIPLERKLGVVGDYDSYNKTVHWVYSTGSGETTGEELVYNTEYNSFTPNKISATSNQSNTPVLADVSRTKEYVYEEESSSDIERKFKSVVYLIVRRGQSDQNIFFTFGKYLNKTFYDWAFVEPTGYEAYLTTGRFVGPMKRGKRQIPYLWTYFKRTESGFTEDFEALTPSSCLVSTHWSWSTSPKSNKWSFPRQAYRIRKVYTPVDEFDNFDTGFELIVTKNKVRGMGKSISIKLESEPGKAMHIYGWAFDLIMDSDD